MVNVSDSYKALAKANGRVISCKILAGDYFFTDSEILSFQFDDIVHSDDMEIGTTCSNRFHFELVTNKIIPLDAVVRPFVYFEGSDEGCPLGEFYISRRYRKRTRYSITCYDKMYRLDSEYKTKLKLPQNMQTVLADLCESLDIEASFTSRSYICRTVPLGCTYRDMIGYIAGANGGCAKFDRSGKLVLKKLANCGETISRSNYTDVSIKADELLVKQIDLLWENEKFTAGKGTNLTTYQQQNPFASELMAQQIYAQYAGFSYYGAEINMQGLPYLEAGDSIYLQNDTDNSLYNIIISEISYTYDGSFFATLSSFSKNPIDEYTEEESEDLQTQTLKMQCHCVRNENQVVISAGTQATLLKLDFEAFSDTGVVFGAEFVLLCTADCQLSLRVFLNDSEIFPKAMVNLKALEYSTVTLHNFLENVQYGVNNLVIIASVSAGICSIEANQAVMTVYGQYLSGEGLADPDKTIAVEMPYFTIFDNSLHISYDENCTTVKKGNCDNAYSQGVSLLAIKRQKLYIDFGGEIADKRPVAEKTEGGVVITFSNPIDSDNMSGEINSLLIGIPKTGGFDYYSPASVTKCDLNKILLEFAGISAASGNCSVSYDNGVGKLKNMLTGSYIGAFTAEFTVN